MNYFDFWISFSTSRFVFMKDILGQLRGENRCSLLLHTIGTIYLTLIRQFSLCLPDNLDPFLLLVTFDEVLSEQLLPINIKRPMNIATTRYNYCYRNSSTTGNLLNLYFCSLHPLDLYSHGLPAASSSLS